jgi:SAM-dependent methyltransferase
VAETNEEQRAYWNEQAGPVWVAFQERLDAQIRPHGELALEALAPGAGERVLDVGCGCGETVLALAERVGPSGTVLGVDVSAPMLALAQQRLEAAGVSHATLRMGDAQSAELGAEAFDAVFSRFGVMFFEDPVAAFANLRAALRPGGRMVFVCWRSPQENPWLTGPMAAVAPLVALPPPPPADAPGMFALADPARLRRVLDDAGFSDLVVEGREPEIVPGGGSLEEAVDTFLSVGPVGRALREAGADKEVRLRVAEAVGRVFEQSLQGGSVRMGSAVWLVRARRPAA